MAVPVEAFSVLITTSILRCSVLLRPSIVRIVVIIACMAGGSVCVAQETNQGAPKGGLSGSYTLKIPEPQKETKPEKPIYSNSSTSPIDKPASISLPGKKQDMIKMPPPSHGLVVPALKVPKEPDSPLLERMLLRGRVVKDPNDEGHISFGIIGISWANMTYPTILAVYPGLPAEGAGLRVYDKILAVDSHSLGGLSVDEVVGLMIDAPGSTMILSIERQGKLSAAVVVRMDVDEIKDPRIRALYADTFRQRTEGAGARSF